MKKSKYFNHLCLIIFNKFLRRQYFELLPKIQKPLDHSKMGVF